MQPLAPFDLVYDTWIADTPVPNLIDADSVFEHPTHLAHQWPYIMGHKLEPLCQHFQYPLRQYRLTDDYPAPSFYPINLGQVDLKIDYFELIPTAVKQHLSQGRLLALFFSPDPVKVLELQKVLQRQQQQHALPDNCYRVVVNNSMAMYQIPWFYHWIDSELEFAGANQHQDPVVIDDRARSHDFTILVRRHQPWRALALAHWNKVGLLDKAYWSYGKFRYDQAMDWNPVHVDRIPNLTESDIKEFLKSVPRACDQIPIGQQADLTFTPDHLVSDSYLHVILDTTMEAQGGAHISEKVWRAIKHGQPFVVLGTHQCLDQLRRLGYRVFDSVIPSNYDKIWDHQARYMAVYRTLLDIQAKGVGTVFKLCMEDIIHNQRLFMASRQQRLMHLQGMLTFDYLHTNNQFHTDMNAHIKIFEAKKNA